MTRTLDQALSGADLSAMQGHSLLINGFHNVSQQYGTTLITASGGSIYATDQWMFGTGTSNMALSAQQVANPFPSQPDIPNGLKIAVTTALATPAAGDFVLVWQPLEGSNLARLQYGATNAKPVTLAFMIRPSITLTGYVGLRNLNGYSRSFLRNFTAPANADTFVYLPIPGDQAATLLTTNAASLGVGWCFAAGSTFQGAADTWLPGNLLAGADCTNLAATVGNNVVISGAVMFPGVIPISQSMLPLLARRYDDDLRLCQRYYEAGTVAIYGYNSGTSLSNYSYSFKSSKRAAPSLTYNVSSSFNISPTNVSNATTEKMDVQATAAATGAFGSVMTFAASARM